MTSGSGEKKTSRLMRHKKEVLARRHAASPTTTTTPMTDADSVATAPAPLPTQQKQTGSYNLVAQRQNELLRVMGVNVNSQDDDENGGGRDGATTTAVVHGGGRRPSSVPKERSPRHESPLSPSQPSSRTQRMHRLKAVQRSASAPKDRRLGESSSASVGAAPTTTGEAPNNNNKPAAPFSRLNHRDWSRRQAVFSLRGAPKADASQQQPASDDNKTAALVMSKPDVAAQITAGRARLRVPSTAEPGAASSSHEEASQPTGSMHSSMSAARRLRAAKAGGTTTTTEETVVAASNKQPQQPRFAHISKTFSDERNKGVDQKSTPEPQRRSRPSPFKRNTREESKAVEKTAATAEPHIISRISKTFSDDRSRTGPLKGDNTTKAETKETAANKPQQQLSRRIGQSFVDDRGRAVPFKAVVKEDTKETVPAAAAAPKLQHFSRISKSFSGDRSLATAKQSTKEEQPAAPEPQPHVSLISKTFSDELSRTSSFKRNVLMKKVQPSPTPPSPPPKATRAEKAAGSKQPQQHPSPKSSWQERKNKAKELVMRRGLSASPSSRSSPSSTPPIVALPATSDASPPPPPHIAPLSSSSLSERRNRAQEVILHHRRGGLEEGHTHGGGEQQQQQHPVVSHPTSDSAEEGGGSWSVVVVEESTSLLRPATTMEDSVKTRDRMELLRTNSSASSGDEADNNGGNGFCGTGDDDEDVLEEDVILVSPRQSPRKSLEQKPEHFQDGQEEEETNANNMSLDFRPLTDNAEEAGTAVVESSWDSSKVLFNEFGTTQDETKKDPNNLFAVDYLLEEKKENCPAASTTIVAMPLQINTENDDLDPLGWPRSPSAFRNKHEQATTDGDLEDVNDDEDNDDGANLLSSPNRSEDLDHLAADDGGGLTENVTPKEKRIATYGTRLADDESSVESASEEDNSDDSDDAEEVKGDNSGYVTQENEKEKEVEDDPKEIPSFNIGNVFAETFEPSSLVAREAQVMQQESLSGEEDSLLAMKNSVDSSSSGLPPKGNLPPPPPPPPPGSKKKRNKSRRKDGGSQSVPLLAPPPAEKLQKWEQSQAAKLAFPEATKAEEKIDETRSVASSPAVPEDAPVCERQQAGADGDGAKETFSLEVATVAKAVAPPQDSTHSPVSSSDVLHDIKMAEKVDLAIEAASKKYEVTKSESQSPSEDRSGGAFTLFSKSKETTDGGGKTGGQQGAISTVDSMLSSLLPETEYTTSEPSAMVADSSPRRMVFPEDGPCPFSAAVATAPGIISSVLDFLGDPVAVCRMKMVNKTCCSFIGQNEHKLMRDAVRLGGMSMNVRPYFWLWVTLEKSAPAPDQSNDDDSEADVFDLLSPSTSEIATLERKGRQGKWHHVIERDVSRAFGNLPPHKTGARLRTDSIVRALVTWGRSRVVKRGVKGAGEGPTTRPLDTVNSDDSSVTPTDTVSDWGGVTPVGSFSGSFGDSSVVGDEGKKKKKRPRNDGKPSEEELVLNGNALTDEMKTALQGKLSFILHALAAAHQDIGYCQGMDYVVAHLLRILQDTIRWKAARGTLPKPVKSTSVSFVPPLENGQDPTEMYAEIDRSLVVEETCFRVMTSFFTTYSLQHFYWPELRCLKTCCRVFEKLIKIKLPVLADHFEHHELNVGLFALGWFQTLFLYLPSMPSATVCHMWDIWLVERSFKIFFRVGTAILFLSQPILLNHELEGMMDYLNTFPDATLLSPDILIACALQIKVTNKMLMELEQEVKDSM